MRQKRRWYGMIKAMGRGKTIGIVGGGQLGRMLTLAAKPLGFEVIVLDPGLNCPAAQVGARQIIGNLHDKQALRQLAEASDVVTIEIEHLDASALEEIAKTGKPVHPAPSTIKMIQDKYLQKQFLTQAAVAVAPYTLITDTASAEAALKNYKGKMILKTRHGAYDGRGNFVIKNPKELKKILETFGPQDLYAEELLPFKKELSVIIARDTKGRAAFYPVVEMKHQRSICLEVLAPAAISDNAHDAALKLAKQVAKHLKGAGIFAIEMFLLKNDQVVVNEIAPRVHNSGHHTIEACVTSQFEQHIRAITGLTLGSTDLVVPAASMVNILGTKNDHLEIDFAKALRVPDTHMHWYGKSPVKIDRKMGHITSTGSTLQIASKHANQARRGVKV
jgi:5-(carboxyamino)imidazole ribonucleotide synthase